MEEVDVKLEASISGTSDVETTQSLPSYTSEKRTRVRKSTAGKRKIRHEWIDEETKRLIAAVKVRPVLWNAGPCEYKYSRLDAWREVLGEVNIEGVDVNEVKCKWLGLRATFKTNLGKLRQRKSGGGALESQTVNWRYFKQMLFLEVNQVHKSTESVSSIEMAASEVTERSILDELNGSPEPLMHNVEKGQRCKRRSMQATPTSSSSSSTSHGPSKLTNTVAALRTLDPNSTFCDHLLAELRTLSEPKSRNLRRQLMQVVYNFMDTSEAEQSRCKLSIKHKKKKKKKSVNK